MTGCCVIQLLGSLFADRHFVCEFADRSLRSGPRAWQLNPRVGLRVRAVIRQVGAAGQKEAVGRKADGEDAEELSVHLHQVCDFRRRLTRLYLRRNEKGRDRVLTMTNPRP